MRVVLSKPEDDSEFQVDTDEGDSQMMMTPCCTYFQGDELDTDDLMITIRTIEDRVLINAPFPCKIVELNGDVEDNSDLVNEDAYQDGWCMIVRPHEWDEDMYRRIRVHRVPERDLTKARKVLATPQSQNFPIKLRQKFDYFLFASQIPFNLNSVQPVLQSAEPFSPSSPVISDIETHQQEAQNLPLERNFFLI